MPDFVRPCESREVIRSPTSFIHHAIFQRKIWIWISLVFGMAKLGTVMFEYNVWAIFAYNWTFCLTLGPQDIFLVRI